MKWLDNLSCSIKQRFKKFKAAKVDSGFDSGSESESESKLPQEKLRISKEMMALVGAGMVIVGIGMAVMLSQSNNKNEPAQKMTSLKDWLPPHQHRTDSVVLEKALKDVKAQAMALSKLEKQWREDSLTTELRWQKIEEALLEIKKNKTASFLKPTFTSEEEKDALSLSTPILRNDTLNLVAPEQPALKKNESNYVPAGSFVKAVLLSGLDVSAGVTSSQEPRPVLMRVMDTGSLPNNLKSQLTGCRLIGAAVGDVSSERAYIRLERLSCVHQDEFTDFPVFGYVAGTDGKAGIRGRVVMKDSAVVSKAFLSGFLGGLSDSAANGLTESSVSPLGQVNSIAAGDVLKYGSYEGASSAMDLYADYLIKRAEQYQPVIEVSAGIPVDVVFHKGFYLEGLSEKDASPLKASKTIPTFYTNVDEEN